MKTTNQIEAKWMKWIITITKSNTGKSYAALRLAKLYDRHFDPNKQQE